MKVTKKQYNGTKIICEYDSSNLKGGVYDTVTKKLEVEFKNNSKYEYENVPHEVFAAMNEAESQGKYFNANIARKYTFKRLI